jgi:hypothetical protein
MTISATSVSGCPSGPCGPEDFDSTVEASEPWALARTGVTVLGVLKLVMINNVRDIIRAFEIFSHDFISSSY